MREEDGFLVSQMEMGWHVRRETRDGWCTGVGLALNLQQPLWLETGRGTCTHMIDSTSPRPPLQGLCPDWHLALEGERDRAVLLLVVTIHCHIAAKKYGIV